MDALWGIISILAVYLAYIIYDFPNDIRRIEEEIQESKYKYYKERGLRR